MKRTMRLLLSTSVVLVCTVTVGVVCAGEQPASPLVVMNAQTTVKGGFGGSVAFLAPDTYETLGSVDVGLSPAGWILSPDERTLYVVDDAGAAGQLAIVDVQARRLLATVEIGPGHPWLLIPETDAAQLYAFSGGDGSRKARITLIDRATHRVLDVIETAPLGRQLLLSPDARRAYVLHGDADGDRRRGEPLLVVVDLSERTVVAAHKLPHAPQGMLLSPDRRWIWVIDRGTPAEDAARHAGGALLVFDALTGSPSATLPLGRDPGPVALDRERGRLYVASRAPGKPHRGSIHGIAGREGFGKVDLDHRPERIFLAPGGARVLVLGEKSASVAEAGLGAPVRHFPLKLSPFDAILSHDGRRAYVNDFGGWKLVALDLLGQEAPREMPVGSGGLRLRVAEKNMLVGLDLLALRHDDRFLYAASTRSNQVSVYDTASLERVAEIRAGNGLYALAQSPNRQHIFALAVSQLSVIDTSANERVREHEVGAAKQGGFIFAKYLEKRPVFSRARGLAFLADGVALHVFELRTGDVLRSINGLPSPQAILIPPSFNAPGDRREGARGADIDDEPIEVAHSSF
jgi:DNA-binding beta-propeller fold protein YncE